MGSKPKFGKSAFRAVGASAVVGLGKGVVSVGQPSASFCKDANLGCCDRQAVSASRETGAVAWCRRLSGELEW